MGSVFVMVRTLMMQKGKMKVIKISMELIVDDDLDYDKDRIANYLNNKLYTDPEFFGDFGPENIVEIKEWE
jgi:hypothetical protein